MLMKAKWERAMHLLSLIDSLSVELYYIIKQNTLNDSLIQTLLHTNTRDISPLFTQSLVNKNSDQICTNVKVE